MYTIKLKNPIPREIEVSYQEFNYQILETIYLPIPDGLPKNSFLDVLENRRTYRQFHELSREKLSILLWLSTRTRERRREESGFIWQHRNVPSAGGRYPIDIISLSVDDDYKFPYLYNPISHAISRLAVNTSELKNLLEFTKQLMPIQSSTILWFVAQVGRTLSKYEDGESLIWRDSGALLATIYFVAEYLGINCCGLGITGDPWISNALSGKGVLAGVGGCVVGEKDDKHNTGISIKVA